MVQAMVQVAYPTCTRHSDSVWSARGSNLGYTYTQLCWTATHTRNGQHGVGCPCAACIDSGWQVLQKDRRELHEAVQGSDDMTQGGDVPGVRGIARHAVQLLQRLQAYTVHMRHTQHVQPLGRWLHIRARHIRLTARLPARKGLQHGFGGLRALVPAILLAGRSRQWVTEGDSG